MQICESKSRGTILTEKGVAKNRQGFAVLRQWFAEQTVIKSRVNQNLPVIHNSLRYHNRKFDAKVSICPISLF